MMSENKKLVPKRRFKEFKNTDAWEQRKFSDIFSYLQNNSLSRADLNYEKGIVKNVHYGDVLIKFGEILDVERAEIPFISNNEFNVSSTSLLQNGDVIIADAAEDETVGKCSEIKGIDGISIVSGLHTIPCRPNKTFVSGYLGYYMNSSSYHDQLLPLIQGTKISSISKSGLQNTDIIFPDSEQEQLQIGQFFQNLDNLITLHQRKLEKTKALKTAYLSEMFPAEGERKPKRRFKGFTNAWEHRKLLESVDKVIDFRGRTPKKLGMDWSDSGYLALSALNVKNGFIDSSVDAHYGDKVLYEAWMSGNELHKGQVLFTTEAPMGNVAQVPDNIGYILSQRTIAFEVKKELITEDYLAVVLGTPKSFAELNALSSGGTAKGVSQKSLSGFQISVPSELKEQEEIAKLFKYLDNLITLHQRNLEKLQNIKNAYLNEMFVGGEQ